MVRRLFIHRNKGKIWSKMSPRLFRLEHGEGWRIKKRVTEDQFRMLVM